MPNAINIKDRMSEQQRSHDMAQARAAKLLMKRTASVSSAFSGDPHGKRKGYAASVSTVSYMENLHEDELTAARHIKYENTYRLEPSERFPLGAVRLMLEEVLTELLEEQTYERDNCPKLTKSISDTVKIRAKGLVDPRFKLICVTHIGQVQGQGVRIGSRCLWNTKHDNSATYMFKNSSLFAIASVYGIYFD